jgi:hypothetical protein
MRRGTGVLLAALASLAVTQAEAQAVTFLLPNAVPGEDTDARFIDCPTPSSCLAIGQKGQVLSSSAPLADPEDGSESRSWRSRTRLPLDNSFAVECVSRDKCIVFGEQIAPASAFGGTEAVLAVSTDASAAAPTWRSVRLPRTRVRNDARRFVPFMRGSYSSQIECRSERLCFLSGFGSYSNHFVVLREPFSARPRARGLVIRDARTGRKLADNGPQELECPSIKLCVVLDENGVAAVSRNPASTRPRFRLHKLPTPGFPQALSCASTTSCITFVAPRFASGSRTTLLASSRPDAGSTGWQRESFVGVEVSGLDCPAVDFCAATGDDNERALALASSTPRAGIEGWQIAPIEGANYPPRGVSCPESQACVAITQQNRTTRMLRILRTP